MWKRFGIVVGLSVMSFKIAHATGWSFVSSSSNTSSAASVSVGQPVTSGDILIVASEANKSGITISDSGSNTGWSNVGAIATGPSSTMNIFYKKSDGTESTITTSAASATQMQMWLGMFSAPAGTFSLDKSATDPDTGSQRTSATTGTTATTSQADELLIAYGATSSTNGGGVSFTNTFTSDLLGTLNMQAYKFPNAVGTYESTISWTTSRRAGAMIATFQSVPAAGASPTPPRRILVTE